MDPVYLNAIAQAGIIIGMTLVGFVCGLTVNVERIARVARWKAELENVPQTE